MAKEPPPQALQDLDARLKRLRAEASAQERKLAPAEPATSGLGMAFLVAAHLVSGLAVGSGIGYLLDRWLATSPALLITFFFLGAAAGGLNVYRTVKGYGMALGYYPASDRGEEEGAASGATPDDDNDDGEGSGGKSA